MVDISNLSNTGSEIGGFFTNLAPGAGDILITLAVVGGIALLITGLAIRVKKGFK